MLGRIDLASMNTTFHRQWVAPVAVSLGLVAITTLLLWQIDVRLNLDHLIFIYFVPTALIALRYGSNAAMGSTIPSKLAAANFPSEPF